MTNVVKSAMSAVCVACLGLAAAGATAQTVFQPPIKITDDAVKYRLSRTANNVMAFDAAGVLHMTYWSGRIATTPSTPSFVYYRTLTNPGGFGEQMQLDNSQVAGIGHLGGRHPTLAIASDQSVNIAWHDHRNSTEAGNWIDNLEIYLDRKPPGGAFSSSDIRITNTAAAGLGDNGFTPRLAAGADGRLTLAWYDFNANAGVSDLYLKQSDANGDFNLNAPIGDARITFETARGGAPEFTVPDLALSSDGTAHLVWAGGQGAGVHLYYMQFPACPTCPGERVLVAGGADFFDPPHVEVAPNDDVWIAFGDDSTGGNENVALLRRPAGSVDFDPPLTVAQNPARQFSVDHAFDGQGRMHLVWLDERSGTHVFYGVFDPASETLIEEVRVTEFSSSWIRPTLALDAEENVYMLFERSLGLAAGEIWFTSTVPIEELNAVETEIWSAYE